MYFFEDIFIKLPLILSDYDFLLTFFVGGGGGNFLIRMVSD